MNKQEIINEIAKQTAIDFANWLDKLTPSERTSVWSKNGEWKGLFTMDNEQLFEKFKKQYKEPYKSILKELEGDGWISVDERLPEEGKYVLARHNRGTWHDSTDQDNVNCVVVKLVKGISMKEREKMKGTDNDYQDSEPKRTDNFIITGLRSDTYKFGDEHDNNKVPYAFDTFGPGTFFGQEITHWRQLPPTDSLPTKVKI